MSQKHYQVFLNDCTHVLNNDVHSIPNFDFVFLDPPFNQGKDYRVHDDTMGEQDYWDWMKSICSLIYEHSSLGAAMYFMQREKNSEHVLRILRETGWQYQNLIAWRKMTSAVPSQIRFGKAYQIIAFATKGIRPRVFHRLRINPPLPVGYKPRETGLFVTDIWDDIRELTSGYFAGDEALRDQEGGRMHKQQSPVALLLRMILSSTRPGDCVFDPFSGTGTTLSVATQLKRYAIGIEKDEHNYNCIVNRIEEVRKADLIEQFRKTYVHTPELNEIWPTKTAPDVPHPELHAV